MGQPSSKKYLESRFLVGELVDELSGCSFEFPLKDRHAVVGEFVFYGMANTINKVRKVLGNKVSLKGFDRVEYFFYFVGEFSQTGVSFQSSKIVVD